jgi:hypothetical protein
VRRWHNYSQLIIKLEVTQFPRYWIHIVIRPSLWVVVKVFFLGQKFLPEGTEIISYREIPKISLIIRTS